MSIHRLPIGLKPMLISLLSLVFIHSAYAKSPCDALPPSTLQIYDIKAPPAEEVTVNALNRVYRDGDLVSRHTLMLTMSDLVVAFDIKHRIVPQADGTVCDAPSLVRIGFGSSRRIALFEQMAAADPCVRQEMRYHEAVHARTLNDVVDRFIDSQQGQLQLGMSALKQTPAPNVTVAKARWELGLKEILDKVKEQLLFDIRSANVPIDAPFVLDALENACGGKIRQIQKNEKSDHKAAPAAGGVRYRPPTPS
jgi:hypothetical protein